jgi:hypothetical protein
MSDNRVSALARFREKTASAVGVLKDFFLRKKVAGMPAGEARSANGANRRELIGDLGMLPVLGLLASQTARAQPQEPATVASPTTGTTWEPFSVERFNFNRFKAIKLDDPKVVEMQKAMPVGKIGNASIGRLVCGSNLIGMNMHSRDLRYVQDLAIQYGSIERIWMTLKNLEQRGVNTFNLKANNFKRFELQRYRTDYGGKLQWIADVIAGTNIDRFEPTLVEHLKLEPAAVYLWGGSSDQWYFQKQEGNIVKAYEIMRKYGVPVGIGAHRLEPVAFCEKEGLKPDFYFLTFHHDRYWSAHPRENRRPLEIFEKNSPDHAKYHDNLFCVDAEGVAAYMQNVKVPWMAFKVMAAGAIPPEDGFSYAFQNGADFICVGMFDWQVEKDVAIAIKTIGDAKNRKRPWFG